MKTNALPPPVGLPKCVSWLGDVIYQVLNVEAARMSVEVTWPVPGR